MASNTKNREASGASAITDAAELLSDYRTREKEGQIPRSEWSWPMPKKEHPEVIGRRGHRA
jgi:hypothetical protein